MDSFWFNILYCSKPILIHFCDPLFESAKRFPIISSDSAGWLTNEWKEKGQREGFVNCIFFLFLSNDEIAVSCHAIRSMSS